MKYKEHLKKLLNLNFADSFNQTVTVGKFEFPSISCYSNIKPDYLALYKDIREYIKTDNTCLCFYEDDIHFDGISGLFNAIYYGDNKLLNKYKERFKNIKCIIAPDYSQLGDLPYIENVYRIYKARLVSLWLLLECDIQVIPNITYASEDYFDIMLDGIKESNTVAISTKGVLRNKQERELLIKAIRYVVDNMPNLETIVVYSVSSNDDKVLKLFDYARVNDIDVVIPSNLLKERNKEVHHGKK